MDTGPDLEFRSCRVDEGVGAELTAAMRAEIEGMYPGLVLDSPKMPKAGPDELGPPHGAFLVGWSDGVPVCSGGLKRLPDGACEIKRMYVVPEARGKGVARRLLAALHDRARALGYTVVRLDSGPEQTHAVALYASEGYVEIANFNDNPAATYFAEKQL
jgi:GNAT superfamily N-acetyltransferase